MLSKIFNFPNTIISRYLLKSLIVFLVSIFFIIGLIVFGNQFVLTVQESVEHGIPFQELMPIVGFNMLRDIPIIFSLSLFLAIIISISQMYKSSEAVIMNSVGIGDKGFIYYIQPIVILSFIVVFILTIYAVPWAKQQKSFAEDQTVNASEFSFITEGKFESFKNGEIVFYASESSAIDSAGEQNMEEVFIYVSSKESPVHENFKDYIFNSPLNGTWILNKSSKPVIRALRTDFTKEILDTGEMDMTAMRGIQDLYFGGDMNAAPALSGQSVGLIEGVKSAEEIIKDTIKEFNETCSKLGGLKL